MIFNGEDLHIWAISIPNICFYAFIYHLEWCFFKTILHSFL